MDIRGQILRKHEGEARGPILAREGKTTSNVFALALMLERLKAGGEGGGGRWRDG